MRVGAWDRVEELFERCLLRCPQLDLWCLYLQYLKLEKRASTKEQVAAYQLLLDAVGPDVSAGPVWIEYVSLLRDAVEPGAMLGSSAVTACRDAFQAALVQPVANLESLWREYELWENTQSGAQAKGVLSDLSERALVARRVARERRALVEPLAAASGQLPRQPKGTHAEAAQLRAWRALWEYEAANPQRLTPQQLDGRMKFTFNQALMYMWLTPQVWHEAALWFDSQSSTETAHSYYQRALEVPS